jgi:hypothetical protein
MPFYLALGFRQVYERLAWERTWRARAQPVTRTASSGGRRQPSSDAPVTGPHPASPAPQGRGIPTIGSSGELNSFPAPQGRGSGHDF